MNQHNQKDILTLTCPFAIDINQINFKDFFIISVDDKQRTVIVKNEKNESFLVNIPKNLYDAIHDSGEKNVISQDLGFDDLSQ